MINVGIFRFLITLEHDTYQSHVIYILKKTEVAVIDLQLIYIHRKKCYTKSDIQCDLKAPWYLK